MINQTQDIQELKRSNPIDEVMADHGYHPVRNRGSQLDYKSPFREESKPSFHVDLEKAPGGVWYDFGAGIGGDVITLVRKLDNLTFAEAVEYLRERRP